MIRGVVLVQRAQKHDASNVVCRSLVLNMHQCGCSRTLIIALRSLIDGSQELTLQSLQRCGHAVYGRACTQAHIYTQRTLECCVYTLAAIVLLAVLR